MSQLRHLFLQIRKLSTSRILLRPTLEQEYKSKTLWDERFNCDLLSSDQNIIKTINAKILSGSELNNLEVDVFINVAAPRKGETAQLTEAASTLAKFRQSLTAHTLLPSTSHAVCRLFSDSNQLSSLVRLLEQRIKYGIFPDSFMLNLLFDQALEMNNLAIASRLAALIMIQEEFGLNALNDNFALYSVSKYIESKSDFSDWLNSTEGPDPVIEPEEFERYKMEEAKNEAKKAAEKGDEEDGDEEEEDDAEYVRIPFLRNPYNDKHFDLTNPREICGKTLVMLGRHLESRNSFNGDLGLGSRCILLGNLLLGEWIEVNNCLKSGVLKKLECDTKFKEAFKFYVENPLESRELDEKLKESIVSDVDKLPFRNSSISQDAEQRHAKLRSVEQDDIKKLSQDIRDWSELRVAAKQEKDAFEVKQKLIAEIKAKKEELKQREQYLYFYDDLKRRNLTGLEYD